MDSLQKIRTFSGFVPARSVQGNTSHFAIGNQGTFAGHGAAHRVLDVGHAVDVISIEPAALIADNVGLHAEARSQMTTPKNKRMHRFLFFVCFFPLQHPPTNLFGHGLTKQNHINAIHGVLGIIFGPKLRGLKKAGSHGLQSD